MLNLFQKTLPAFFAISLFAASCSDEVAEVNQLTEKEKKEGWVSLFDGKTTNGWHLYNKGNIPSIWKVKDGELYCSNEDSATQGDLVSDKVFENFDLRFDWKIPKEGNSGVFINVQEDTSIQYAWASGPEYQLLEISHPDRTKPLKQSGCLYNFYPQKNAAEMKPQGEWNQSRIKQSNGKIEFYLNGVQTAQADFLSQNWKDTLSKSGFAKFPEFGKHTKGRIGLQFWTKGISFRNIKVKEL